MTGKPTSARARVADAFAGAEASGQAKAWDRAKQVLVDTIATCELTELRGLVRLPGVEDGWSGEAPVWPEVIVALLERAGAASGKDAGGFAGWAARAAAMSYTELIGPGSSAGKPEVVATLHEQRERLLAWLDDDEQHRRCAGAMLLGRSSEGDDDDLCRLLDAAEREAKPAALASSLLAAGLVSRRLADRVPELDERLDALVDAKLGHRDRLVRLCAITVAALTGRSLDASELSAALEHLAKPVALPPAWGWSGPKSNARSDQVVLRLLGWAPVDRARARARGRDRARAQRFDRATSSPRFDPRQFAD